MGEMPPEFKNAQLKADEYERQKKEVEDQKLFEEEQIRKGIRKKEVKPYEVRHSLVRTESDNEKRDKLMHPTELEKFYDRIQQAQK